jgi:hypothetical protein
LEIAIQTVEPVVIILNACIDAGEMPIRGSVLSDLYYFKQLLTMGASLGTTRMNSVELGEVTLDTVLNGGSFRLYLKSNRKTR